MRWFTAWLLVSGVSLGLFGCNGQAGPGEGPPPGDPVLPGDRVPPDDQMPPGSAEPGQQPPIDRQPPVDGQTIPQQQPPVQPNPSDRPVTPAPSDEQGALLQSDQLSEPAGSPGSNARLPDADNATPAAVPPLPDTSDQSPPPPGIEAGDESAGGIGDGFGAETDLPQPRSGEPDLLESASPESGD